MGKVITVKFICDSDEAMDEAIRDIRNSLNDRVCDRAAPWIPGAALAGIREIIIERRFGGSSDNYEFYRIDLKR